MTTLQSDGFELHRSVVSNEMIDQLQVEVDRLIQKTGNRCIRNLRRDSALIDELSLSPSFLTLVPDGHQPVRSILFDKTADHNWPVAWHQDLTIAVRQKVELTGYGPWSEKQGHPHVQPPIDLLQSMVTLRLHLDDTPESNGALQVVPNSHLSRRAIDEISEQERSMAMVCECSAGDVLLMSPLIVHSSNRSVQPKRRRVIHIEYAQREQLHTQLEWLEL